mmetsp:Transcript_9834/g.21300  ORF Transcript_9834/g.21300 Transcript_9834/m.21300 type:complete len:566 (-) Transcript_9834:356-2053(-)
MRILLPSSTIAIITGVCHSSLAAADSVRDEAISNNDNNNLPSNVGTAASQVVRDVDAAYESSIRRREGEECNTFQSSSNRIRTADLGILGCGKNQTCERDVSSSIGGRCTASVELSSSSSSITTTTQQQLLQQRLESVAVASSEKPKVAIFPSKRKARLAKKQRLLQVGSGPGGDEEDEEDKPFVCPTKCPQEFCDCAQNDGDGEKCAPELYEVCKADLLAECVPDDYLPFYKDTYCPFAKCLTVENRPYELCSCDYYRDYCELYYGFEDSLEECAIATCCEAEATGEKYVCLPGMAPTYSPTLDPTNSFPPSVAPSVTSPPSSTTAPSDTQAPTDRPSNTQVPSVTLVPTPIPTDSPSEHPSMSSSPTTSPTKSPTVSPTKGPTTSPTVFPSLEPSYPPSASPSASPTATSRPTISFKPTTSPSNSFRPTITAVPTATPSNSAFPTWPPSLTPTHTQPPSSMPTTPAPTDNPTVSPTEYPSATPTKEPTKAPNTDDPTEEPTMNPTEFPTESPTEPLVQPGDRGPIEETKPPGSSGMALGGSKSRGVLMASLLTGVGGALWLLG